MDWLLLTLTIVPGIFILGWIYKQDKYQREPFGLLLISFIGGAVATVPVIFANFWWVSNGFGISPDIGGTAFYAFISVGGTEELAKLLMVLLLVYRNKKFDEPFDGIVYAVSVSMGFATAENLIYVFLNSTGKEAYWVAVVRAFTALPAHATFAILMGFFLGISKFRQERMAFIFIGYLTAVLFHGAYDFFLFLNNIPGISIGAFVSLFVGIRLSRRAIQLNQHISPFKHEGSER